MIIQMIIQALDAAVDRKFHDIGFKTKIAAGCRGMAALANPE